MPRTGDSPEEHILRTTEAAFAHGERTIADLLDAQNVVTRFLIHEQVRAGVEVLTDGGARWHDPLSHIAAKFDGITLGASRPLPFRAGEYRVPQITGKLMRRNDPQRMLADEYRFARNALGQLPTSPERAGRLSLKPVLVGPYTLARYSESTRREFSSVQARTEAFAEMLAQEIAPLAAAGASLVQFDEPAILENARDWELVQAAFSHIATVRDATARTGRRIQLAVHVYAGPQNHLLDKLCKLSVDFLGLDFAAEPALANALPANLKHNIVAGLVSATSATLESESSIRATLDAVLAKASGSVQIAPASGLETLAPAAALGKLALLAKLRR